MKLRAIIIDDEESAVNNISFNIDEYCSDKIEVIASATDPLEGIKLVKNHKPDILFLDVQMPKLDGFQVLEKLNELSFFLIFISAYSKYGVRAVKASAFDYLLKPLDPLEFKGTIEKIYNINQEFIEKGEKIELNRTALKLLKQNLKSTEAPSEIMVSHNDYMVKLNVSDILYIEAEVNYVYIYVNDGRKMLVARTLKSFEEILDKNIFLRIHKSYIVNKSFIKKAIKKEQYFIILNNEQELPLARRRAKSILNTL